MRGDWKTADDAYHHFDEAESGTANWLHLKLTAEPLDDPNESCYEMCAICFSCTQKSETLSCGHKFHGECISEWWKRSDTCLLCRAKSAMTPYMKEVAGL